jgi:Dyp-type peroxidase family
MATKSLNLANIQGNVLGGFNKDFQTFLFVKFNGSTEGRAWIKAIADGDLDIGVAKSDSASVLEFNAQFKALTAEGVKPETVIAAAWTNLAISFQGLAALGVKSADLNKFPKAFKDGMAARKAAIGDTGTSDPGTWIAPFGSNDLHAVVLLAADSEAMLTARVTAVTSSPEFKAGVTVLLRQEGRTRTDERGHEHFGFKDGVSQPGIRGTTVPDDPIGNPDQGHPGQDLLWPGEFVLGYPTQKPKAKTGVDGPNPDPGPPSTSGPTWTTDGTYLVFRRLAQDVPGFRAHVKALATANGLSEDLMGAKLVGRYRSGCPLEARKFQPLPFTPASTDPGIATLALADSDVLNNNFEFGDDPDGGICPLAAHIRKAYPRDEQTTPDPAQSESSTQTHRLLRRGIPFGNSFGAPQGGGANDPRGLLFLAYQKDIESQFEFVQQSWVNNTGFPPFPAGSTPGQDPIIAQSSSGPFQLAPGKAPITVSHFVTTTGGEYFFCPSIDVLQNLGDNKL